MSSPQPDEKQRLLERFSAAAHNGSAPADIPAEQPEPAGAYELAAQVCFQHDQVAGLYYCQYCNKWRCKECAHVYEGVAVCPDCDTLSLHADKLYAQMHTQIEEERPYSWHLMRAATFPLRHYIFTTIVWLLVWIAGAAGEAASDLVNAPPIHAIVLGPMVGWVGKGLAFMVLGIFATGCLLARADGKEGLDSNKIMDYSIVTEPIAFWSINALLSFGPLITYLGYRQFQEILIIIFVGNNLGPAPEPTLLSYMITAVLAVWALAYYYLGQVVTAVRRSAFPLFNPLNLIAGWNALKDWLKYAFALVVAVNIVALAIVFFIGGEKLGLPLSAAVFTITTLISAEAVGAAVHSGWDSMELRD